MSKPAVVVYRWNQLTGKFDIPVTIEQITADRGRRNCAPARRMPGPSGSTTAAGFDSSGLPGSAAGAKSAGAETSLMENPAPVSEPAQKDLIILRRLF
ncbi:MAG: hypothetical protein PHO01_08060 [Desulfotomaculaceae bacterium]|nr:hypothetical protein [Desulfotomaculaceae bacterium]